MESAPEDLKPKLHHDDATAGSVAGRPEDGGFKGAELQGGRETQAEAHRSEREIKAVPFYQLFRFADFQDVVLMVLGTVGACLDGFSLPGMLLVMGGLINSFGNYSTGTHNNQDLVADVHKYTKLFAYIATGTMVAAYLEAACWMRTGERQASKMRHQYLRAILRQDVSFFDLSGTSTAEVVNSVSADALAIQEVFSEKIPHFLMNSSGFVAGYVVAFFLSPKMAGFILGFSPLLIIPGILYGRTLAGLARQMQVQYLAAGTVAEQALSSIRTVYSFVGEENTNAAYSRALGPTIRIGKQQGLAKGLALGMNGVTYLIWAFGAFYGSRLSINEGVQGGKIVATGLAGMLGGLALGMALPDMKYFFEATIAASTIFSMIDRVPAIDSDNMKGSVLERVEGHLELRNVDFTYPSRPDSIVFQDFCLTIPPGQTVALVGSSGSGKSTAIALIERFYDPVRGQVLVDGVNIKDIQLKWLRMQIGLVSQEPALFATTIMANILFGKDGATTEEAIAAAKAANAHDFISVLPHGYDTEVGERGVQMSGGQKQRIAIARAMLKNPPILLLDEATSALDAESERIVQAALENVAMGRTTVIVAHRLSTIRNADKIAVVQGGKVVETGRHEELLELGPTGVYSSLIHLQRHVASQKELHDELAVARHSSSRVSGIVQRGSVSERFSARLSAGSGPSMGRSGRMSSGRLSNVAPEVEDVGGSAPSFRRLLAMSRPEWKHALLGCLGAAGFGFVQPTYALLLGSLVSVFYYTNKDDEKRVVGRFSIAFAALFVAALVTNVIQHYNLQAMGEKLTRRVRELLLRKILTFEVGWFDRDENSSGAISTRLASEASVVRALVGDRVALVVQVLSATLFAATVGLVVAWKLALVMIALQPLVILSFYGKRVLLKSESAATMKEQEESSALASEAVCNHRTITAFCSQDKIVGLFDALQDGNRREATYRANVAGVGLGLAQFCVYCTWAVDFYYGGMQVSRNEISFKDMFICFFVLVTSGRLIADAGSMTSDISKGANAVAGLFGILDRKSGIPPDDPAAEKVDKVSGYIEVKDVDFAYPSRPELMVFRNFSLKVKAGRSVALVGQSGSGKSTIIGLVQRFYDPLRGKVKIDGKDVAKLHLQTLRRHMSLVGQEPQLFLGSIRTNILYSRDNASEAEVVEAAKAANAHDFISSLRDGYDTQVGERGVQLSGGQKQRIAIARAIIKNPAILLLDEATSALDAQSEKVVQDALDRIMVGRTTVVVAHRLATVRGADSIAVLQDGAILEQGSHEELMDKGEGGAYYQLVQLQSKDKL